MIHPILIHGRWQASAAAESFHAVNPASGEELPDAYPVSQWPDIDAALSAARDAAERLRAVTPTVLADFLGRYAGRIEARAAEITAAANLETALPVSPRLLTVELPRTTNQLRLAAAAAREGSWALPTIDSKANIRSCFSAIGPVAVFGPNNFPLAFNAISGGDFAAAIAAGNPVIAKAHPGHPTTTRLLAEEAVEALRESGLPAGMVQLVYHMSADTGLRLAGDRRLGALAFTGSRRGGLALKAAADAAGVPAYLEMSSLNPVVILPGALRERGEKIADEFADSALAASGQFCTNPGLTLLLAGVESEAFVAGVKQRFEGRGPGALLSAGLCKGLEAAVQTLVRAGARVVTGGGAVGAGRFGNTLLRVEGEVFLGNAEALQTEAFGNASVMVVARDAEQLVAIVGELEGNLTGCIYSDAGGGDDGVYGRVAAVLRPRVGRLLNDKMPTGVAVSAAMNHGGPYPATGHPGFTAVGIPASLRRFAMLQCYDNVRKERLPALLGDKNPTGGTWRMIDGGWTQGDAVL